MLPRASRLRRRADIRAVYEHGQAVHGALLHLRFLRVPGRPQSRVGIVVSKTISKKATHRNLVRRRLREAMRQALTTGPSGYDLVLIARTQALGKSYQELARECVALLRRLPPTTNTTNMKKK